MRYTLTARTTPRLCHCLPLDLLCLRYILETPICHVSSTRVPWGMPELLTGLLLTSPIPPTGGRRAARMAPIQDREAYVQSLRVTL